MSEITDGPGLVNEKFTELTKVTNTLIVGASVSGLASAACLGKAGIEYIVIEKHAAAVTPWRNHYDRLHLHTNKTLSG
jgi:cation diffusion facilitator CzcD-associated flavoprotein CzcO